MSHTWRRLSLIALAAAIAFIIWASLYPFEYRVPANSSGPLIALIQSAGDRILWDDFTANIALYGPIGFFGVLAIPAGASVGRRLALTLLLGAALTVGIELMQYYVQRETSAFDVYANLLGTLLGAVGGMVASRRLG